jgi:hypothetical protein
VNHIGFRTDRITARWATVHRTRWWSRAEELRNRRNP